MRLLTRALVALFALLSSVPPALAVDRDPMDVPLKQYGFLLGTAILGGFVSWYSRVRKGAQMSLGILIGELTTSAFAGLLAFWLCTWANASPALTASLVGIAGHMGGRAISLFEDWAVRRFNLGGTP